MLPVPFHFLDLVQGMNVKPAHYGWVEFYKLVCETFDYCFSFKAMARRHGASNPNRLLGMEQFFRGWSSERNNRLAHHRKMLHWLQTDAEVRDFFEGRTPGNPLGDDEHHQAAPGPAVGVAPGERAALRSQRVPALRDDAPAAGGAGGAVMV